jgi:hypothetical protein
MLFSYRPEWQPQGKDWWAEVLVIVKLIASGRVYKYKSGCLQAGEVRKTFRCRSKGLTCMPIVEAELLTMIESWSHTYRDGNYNETAPHLDPTLTSKFVASGSAAAARLMLRLSEVTHFFPSAALDNRSR